MPNKMMDKWIAAAKILIVEASASVECPECEQAMLQVYDVPDRKNPRKVLERILRCPQCGKYNAILKPRTSK